MQNNPFENGNNNHGTLANAGQKRSGISVVVKVIVVFTLIIAVSLGLFIGLFSGGLDTSLDLPTGSDITLTSRDFESCHEFYESVEYPCFAFESGIEFEPGLYTLVITPRDGVTLDSTYMSINPELDNYYGREPDTFYDRWFSDFPGLTSAIEIENVPLTIGSQIVITDFEKGESFVDFAKEDVITIEFIAQSKYVPFENNSGKTGFYPVGKAIAPGKYELVDEGFSLKMRGYVAVKDLSDYDLDQYGEIMLYDGSFELEETDIFVSYDSSLTLE